MFSFLVLVGVVFAQSRNRTTMADAAAFRSFLDSLGCLTTADCALGDWTTTSNCADFSSRNNDLLQCGDNGAVVYITLELMEKLNGTISSEIMRLTGLNHVDLFNNVCLLGVC